MIPLIDADVLRYEIGSCGEYVDDNGEKVIRSFEFVSNLLDDKIKEIQELAWADESPILFLTSCPRTHKILHRKSNVDWKPNFREAVATVKPYKERKGEKPFHYENLTAYMLSHYKCVVAEGMEADDLLAVYQTNFESGKWHDERGGRVESIICTRDKDLRMVPGMHFGWACGKQEAFGPERVDERGYLQGTYGDDGKLSKVHGTGNSFFCYQLLAGDPVDSIPGIPRVGPVKALETLEGCDSVDSMLKAVRERYRAFYGDEWASHMTEQGKLLWMVRELEDGKPVTWKLPEVLLND